MPKEIKELQQFLQGTITNPSALDIPDEAATNSLNIDCLSEDGKLKGMQTNVKLKLSPEYESGVIVEGDLKTTRITIEGTNDDGNGNSLLATNDIIVFSVKNADDQQDTIFTVGTVNANDIAANDTAWGVIAAEFINGGTIEADYTGFFYNVDLIRHLDETNYSPTHDIDGNLTGGTEPPIYGIQFEHVNDIEIAYTCLYEGTEAQVTIYDDTDYLEINATEMEVFNDGPNHNIAYFLRDTTTVPPTHRIEVLQDFYEASESHKRLISNSSPNEVADQDDIMFNIPTAEDVTIEKSNNQIYIGCGNNGVTKSKWLGKIPHKQFGESIEGYRLEDSELYPVDKGSSVFNLSKVIAPWNSNNSTDLQTRDIMIGTSDGSLFPYVVDNTGQDDDDQAAGYNADLGKMYQGGSMFAYTWKTLCPSRWAHKVSTTHGQGSDAPAAGYERYYIWTAESTKNVIHLEAIDWDPTAKDVTVTSKVAITIDWPSERGDDWIEQGGPPPADAYIGDILETYDGTDHVIWLLMQRDESKFSWEEYYLYCFKIEETPNYDTANGESALASNAVVADVFNCSMSMKKVYNYGAWSGSDMVADGVQFKYAMTSYSWDCWMGTWHCRSNKLYTRKGGAYPGKMHSNGFKKLTGRQWYYGDVSGLSSSTKLNLGHHLGWNESEKLELRPERNGLVALGYGDGTEGHTVGVLADVKGKWQHDGGEIKVKQYESWTSRRHNIERHAAPQTYSLDEVVMIQAKWSHCNGEAVAGWGTGSNLGGFGPSHRYNTYGDSAWWSDTWDSGTGNMIGSTLNNDDGKIIYRFDSDTVGNNTQTEQFSGEIPFNSIADNVSDMYGHSTYLNHSLNSTNKPLLISQKGQNGNYTYISGWEFSFGNTAGNPIHQNISSGLPILSGTPGFPIMLSASQAGTLGRSFIDVVETAANTWKVFCNPTQGIYQNGNAKLVNSGSYVWTDYNAETDPSIDEANYVDDSAASILSYGISINGGDLTETVDDEQQPGNFNTGTIYYYKMSLLYDGFQESPMNTYYFQFEPASNYNSAQLTISLSKPSPRVSAIVVYRKNSVEEFYRMIGEMELKSGWSYNSYKDQYFGIMLDDGNLSATYEAITGMPESILDTSINYRLSCSAGGYLVVADCYHPEIKHGENFLFRSQPGNYSVFNWSSDFLVLPNVPTAIAYWAGRVFAFDNANMFKINLENLAVEDKYEGIGCFSENSFIVTDYGMFFCDKNNMFQHDGQKTTPIGNNIMRSSSNIAEAYTWHNIKHRFPPQVTYDAEKGNVLFCFSDEGGFNGAWSYNITRKRWDLIEIPEPLSTVLGPKGEVLLSDGTNLIQLHSDITELAQWNFLSKKLHFGHNTQIKNLTKIKILCPGSNIALLTSKLIYGVNVKIYLDDVVVASGNVVVALEDGLMNIKLKAGYKQAKQIQIEFLNMQIEVDAVGIIFRRKTIK